MSTIYKVGDVMVARGPGDENLGGDGGEDGRTRGGEGIGGPARSSGEDPGPRGEDAGPSGEERGLWGEDVRSHGDHLPPWHPGFSIAAFLSTRDANSVSSELFFDVVVHREVQERMQAVTARLVATEVLRNHFISHSFSTDVEVVRPPSNFLELVEACFHRGMIKKVERNLLRKVNHNFNKAIHDIEW